MTLFANPAVSFIVKVFFALVFLDIGNRVLMTHPQPTPSDSPTDSPSTAQAVPQTRAPPLVSESTSGDNDTVLFLYCGCCTGTKNKFEDLKNLLSTEFPQLSFLGHTYPVKTSAKLLANSIYVIQIGVSILLLGGHWIFGKLGIVPPPIFHKLVQYKMFVLLGLYFFSNHVRSILINTNAFEVYFNQELLYSKLTSGEYPTYDVLHALITEQTAIL